MKWFYAENGSQRGPVEEAELERLAASGAIRPSTLVWCEGMAHWKPYAEVRPVAAGVPVAGGVVCAGCGGVFRQDEVVRVEGRMVCAVCKPTFLQKLLEGVSPSGAGFHRRVSEAELLQRDYPVDIGEALGRSWETFKADPWTIIGVSLLAYIALAAGGIIPLLGPLIQIAVQGAIIGGVWLFYLKKARGQAVGVADAFSGFGPRFGSLFMASFIPMLFVVGIVLCAAIPLAVVIPAAVKAARSGSGSGLSMAAIAALAAGGLLLFGVLMVVQMMWFFALPLVIDKGYAFWPALELSRKIVLKRFWSTLLLLLVVWLVMVAGMFACLIGLLVTGPLGFGMLAQHYEKVFGDLTPQS